MTPELITATIACLGALTAFLKARSDVSEIKEERKETKTERDTKIALLESKVGDLEKRLEDGSSRFDRIEDELKSTNKTLSEIVGSLNTLITLKEGKK